MAEISSSQRLTPERAPRLRRIAELIDDQAHRASDPARAHELACAMRLRASALETGHGIGDEQEFDAEIQSLGFDSS